MLNNVKLHGRITRDPEVKYTQSAEPKAMATFSIAVNRRKEGVDFINCQAWGVVAETMEKYLSKGSEVIVSGRLQVDTVEKDGNKVTYTKVIVEEFDFCGSKSSNESSAAAAGSRESEPMQPTMEDEDDLPF